MESYRERLRELVRERSREMDRCKSKSDSLKRSKSFTEISSSLDLERHDSVGFKGPMYRTLTGLGRRLSEALDPSGRPCKGKSAVETVQEDDLAKQMSSMLYVEETKQEDEDKKNDEDEMKKRVERHSGLFASNSKLDASMLSFKCPECNLVLHAEAMLEHKRELHPSSIPSPTIVSSVLHEAETWLEYERNNKNPTLLEEDERKKQLDKEEKGVDPVFEVHDGEEVWLIDERVRFLFRFCAQFALDYYNDQNPGKRYGLVECGPMISTPTLDHINFKAKEEDCPDAPVETFFAQLSQVPGVRGLTVDCCLSLGPSHKLPNWRERSELNGCRLCSPRLKHPRERVANLILDPNRTGELYRRPK